MPTARSTSSRVCIGGRDIIAAKLAEYAKLPGGVSLPFATCWPLSKILMALDPETLDRVHQNPGTSATGQHIALETKPPSLFQLSPNERHQRRCTPSRTLVYDASARTPWTRVSRKHRRRPGSTDSMTRVTIYADASSIAQVPGAFETVVACHGLTVRPQVVPTPLDAAFICHCRLPAWAQAFT